MRNSILLLILAVVISGAYSCARPKGNDAETKRAYVLNMKDQTLAELYKKKPEAKTIVENAAGYGVFSNFNTQLLIIGSGNGYGVVINNSTGDKTYMEMAEGGIGLGVALKDFREVIVFVNKTTLHEFVKSGWNFGVQGDAALQSDDKGGAVTGEVPLDSDVIIYQITESGIALRTNIGASKYWIDSELNYY